MNISLKVGATDRNAAPIRRDCGLGKLVVVSILLALVLIAFLVAFYRTAWLCDDAYITFRTVHNFVNGYGMRWNIQERVQSFTHPLWFLAASVLYFVAGDIYYPIILFSVLLGMTSLICFSVAHRDRPVRLLTVLLGLLFSRAFVEYCTSGLENPLSYFLLTSFFLVFICFQHNHHAFFWLCLLGGLGMLNRLDTGLLYLPAMAHVWMGLRDRRAVLLAALAMTPLLAWFVFSLVYYGFPFPNTAYAKLGADIPRGEMLQYGWNYLRNAALYDPMTVSLIAAAVAASLLSGEKGLLPWFVGIVLYMMYIVHIGGDFMGGRYFSLPVLLSAMVLVRTPWKPAAAVSTVLCMAVFCGSMYWCRHKEQESIKNMGILMAGTVDKNFIADERMFYFKNTGLVNSQDKAHVTQYPAPGINRQGVRNTRFEVRTYDRTGMDGFFLGEHIHLVDVYALGDPLLARLPARFTPKYRIGHFTRQVPEGYEETLRTGVNQIADRDLARYYDLLCVSTRAPLFSWNRFKTIVLLNSGAYDSLIDKDACRFPGIKRVSRTDLLCTKSSPNERREDVIPPGGLHVQWDAATTAAALGIGVRGGAYYILFMRGAEVAAVIPETSVAMFAWSGLTPGDDVREISLPVSGDKFDAVRIMPMTAYDENLLFKLEMK